MYDTKPYLTNNSGWAGDQRKLVWYGRAALSRPRASLNHFVQTTIEPQLASLLENTQAILPHPDRGATLVYLVTTNKVHPQYTVAPQTLPEACHWHTTLQYMCIYRWCSVDACRSFSCSSKINVAVKGCPTTGTVSGTGDVCSPSLLCCL